MNIDAVLAGCYSDPACHGKHAGFCISRAECQHTRPLDASFGRCAEPSHLTVFSRIAVAGVLAMVGAGVFAMPGPNTLDDFWARVDKNDASGCWTWQGTLNHGYGMFKLAGKWRYVHRLAYELLIGPIPKGLILHHKCLNPRCVRAGEHVILATRRQNTVEYHDSTLAGKFARLTSCKHGHPFTEENTRLELSDKHPERITRRCRECERLRALRRGNGWERQRQIKRQALPEWGTL